MTIKQIHRVIWIFLLSIANSGYSDDMRLWFSQEAENRSESLALDNGRLGAVLFHCVTKELVHISEETLWINSPVSVEEGSRMKEHIPALWRLLGNNRFREATELVNKYCCDKRPQLRVDLMSNMTLTFPNHDHFGDYCRELDT